MALWGELCMLAHAHNICQIAVYTDEVLCAALYMLFKSSVFLEI